MVDIKKVITVIFVLLAIILAIPGILFSVSWVHYDIFLYWHSIQPGYFVLMMFAYIILLILGVIVLNLQLINGNFETSRKQRKVIGAYLIIALLITFFVVSLIGVEWAFAVGMLFLITAVVFSNIYYKKLRK